MLSLITCCFEGAIFLMRFFWPGALQRAHDAHDGDGDAGAIPYGVIFAAFMAIMALGAVSFEMLARPGKREEEAARDSRKRWFGFCTVPSPAHLLTSALFLSGASFVAAAFAQTEAGLFCSFLVLEACNGLYVPSMACHRSRMVDNRARTSVYSLMNMPLFIFVVAALQTTTISSPSTSGE